MKKATSSLGDGAAIPVRPLVNSWILQAVDRTNLEQGREWLVDTLQARFPADVTPEVIDTINQQPSVVLLRSWHQSALTSATYSDCLNVLRQ